MLWKAGTGANNLEDGRASVHRLLHPAAENLLARLRPMAIVQEQAAAAKAGNGLWAGPRYTTHPLVREVAAEMLASRTPEERMQACRAFAHFMLSCGAEIETIARRSLEAQNITQELLSIELVNFRELSRLLAELACKILSPQHPQSLVDLAALLWDLGHLAAAAELGRATLKALEPDHTELLHARSRLQYMLTYEGALAQAEKLARKTLDSLAARLGESHADAVSARENLALTLWQREQMHNTPGGQDGGMGTAARRMVAVEKDRERLTRGARMMGIEPSMYPRSIGSFLYLFTLLTKVVANAAVYLCRAGILILILFFLSYSFYRFLSYPSVLCFSVLLLNVVISIFLYTLHVVRGFGRPRLQTASAPLHRLPDVTGLVRMRGSVRDRCISAAAEDDEVLELQLAVLQAREAAQGPEHLDTIFARANMAATLRQRGQLDEAAELLRGVFAAQVRVLGEGHPDTMRTRTEMIKTQMQVDEDQ